jgi:hypothetical protein
MLILPLRRKKSERKIGVIPFANISIEWPMVTKFPVFYADAWCAILSNNAASKSVIAADRYSMADQWAGLGMLGLERQGPGVRIGAVLVRQPSQPADERNGGQPPVGVWAERPVHRTAISWVMKHE